ncbi:MAG: lysis system i-spanin subunit Rz [Gallionella sp.]
MTGAAGPYILIAAGTLILALGTAAGYQKYRAVQIQGEYDKHLAGDDKKAAEASEANRKAEAAHASQLAALRDHYQAEIDNEKAAADRIIADLKSGNLKLRKRFSCDQGAAIAGTASSGDGAAQGGLQSSDVEFLIGIASEADIIVNQLTLAQGVIVRQRETCNGPVRLDSLQEAIRKH